MRRAPARTPPLTKDSVTTVLLSAACDRTVRRSQRPVADRARMLSEGSMFQQALLEALRTMAEAHVRGEHAAAAGPAGHGGLLARVLGLLRLLAPFKKLE